MRLGRSAGDATLASIREASLRAAQTNREEEGICMAILPGRRAARVVLGVLGGARTLSDTIFTWRGKMHGRNARV